MTDPTPAEIEAGAKAFAEEALDSAGRWTDRATPREVATAVLRAVLPGHDARLRAQVGEGIARAIEAQRPDACDDPDCWAHPHPQPAYWATAIARAHTTGGDHERDD